MLLLESEPSDVVPPLSSLEAHAAAVCPFCGGGVQSAPDCCLEEGGRMRPPLERVCLTKAFSGLAPPCLFGPINSVLLIN